LAKTGGLAPGIFPVAVRVIHKYKSRNGVNL
jgi:hypothetical protein